MKKDQQDQNCTRDDLVKGLPTFTASAPEILAKEKADLAELEGKGLLVQWKSYFGKTGPGWLQSALVLGSGSAMASLFAGAFLQYKLLWVQPLAMALGIVIFAAMSYQTLSTGVRPFYAMKHYIHPVVAWSWAIGALLATIMLLYLYRARNSMHEGNCYYRGLSLSSMINEIRVTSSSRTNVGPG